MASLTEVAKVMGVLAALYPRYTRTKATITAYHVVLGDIPADLLDRAALHVGSQNTFFPAAAELRAAAFELMERAHGVPGAWEAWAEVCKSFGPCGRWRSPQWTHPLIGQAVDAIGGYIALCDSENATADRARFVQAYDALLARAQKDARMLPEVRQMVRHIASGEVKQLEALVGEFTRGMGETR